MGTRMDMDDMKFALKRSLAATSDQGHKSGLVAPALGSIDGEHQVAVVTTAAEHCTGKYRNPPS